MTTPVRLVPLSYEELVAAIASGTFPHERQWIAFKRRLYPESGETSAKARDKVSQELALDLASMAEAGGFLVYGVKEDKAGHSFTPDEMDLPVGLHETVDAVARDRVTPPLNVIPTPVPNPATRTTGFLVVEIPESPDSPHGRLHLLGQVGDRENRMPTTTAAGSAPASGRSGRTSRPRRRGCGRCRPTRSRRAGCSPRGWTGIPRSWSG